MRQFIRISSQEIVILLFGFLLQGCLLTPQPESVVISFWSDVVDCNLDKAYQSAIFADSQSQLTVNTSLQAMCSLYGGSLSSLYSDLVIEDLQQTGEGEVFVSYSYRSNDKRVSNRDRLVWQNGGWKIIISVSGSETSVEPDGQNSVEDYQRVNSSSKSSDPLLRFFEDLFLGSNKTDSQSPDLPQPNRSKPKKSTQDPLLDFFMEAFNFGESDPKPSKPKVTHQDHQDPIMDFVTGIFRSIFGVKGVPNPSPKRMPIPTPDQDPVIQFEEAMIQFEKAMLQLGDAVEAYARDCGTYAVKGGIEELLKGSNNPRCRYKGPWLDPDWVDLGLPLPRIEASQEGASLSAEGSVSFRKFLCKQEVGQPRTTQTRCIERLW